MASFRDEEVSGDITISADDSIHSLTVRKTCAALFRKNQFVDVTLSCKDGQLQAHRLILSSASPYLYNLFTSTSSTATPSCNQPIIILRNSNVMDVQSALEFIYSGKTRVSKSKLASLLEVGQDLGCNSLKKAIEVATEAGRLETLKLKQIASSNQDPPPAIQFQLDHFNSQVKASLKRSNDSSTPIPKLLRMSGAGPSHSDHRRNILVSTNSDQQRHQQGQGLSWLSSGSANKQKRTTTTNTKTTDCQSKNRTSLLKNSGSRSNTSISDLGQAQSQQFGSSNHQNPSSNSKVQLQHDKGESFIYTNENLGMHLFEQEDEDNDEEDPDESEEELKTTLPVSHLPQISVKPVKSSNTNADSLPRFDLIKSEHLLEEGGELPCPWCMQVFKNLANLQIHIKTHVTPNGNYKPYTCEYCQHEFGRSAHLKRHLRTHTGEKPYECLVCQRVFSRQDKMKTHLKVHMTQDIPVTSNSKPHSNNSMTITSYPPPSHSQSSGGQVPIKVLIPTGHGTHSKVQSSVSVTKHESEPPTLIKQETGNSPSPVGSPSAFFSDMPGPSISINASPNLKMPTLTPQTFLSGKHHNFLVN